MLFSKNCCRRWTARLDTRRMSFAGAYVSWQFSSRPWRRVIVFLGGICTREPMSAGIRVEDP